MKAILRTYLLVFSFLFSFESLSAQVVQLWRNDITTNNAGQLNPYQINDVVNNNITVSGIGRGSVNTGMNSTGTYGTTNWPTSTTPDLNAYFYFTLTPKTGYRMTLTSFSYVGVTSSKAPTAFSFRTDAASNNFVTPIGTPTVTGTTIALSNASLSTSTSYRLYGWNSGSGAGRDWSIDNFSFSGSVLGSPTTSLTGLGYVYGASTSTAQSFQVNGAGLTSSTITITGSTNYEVSTTSATSNFGSSATLTAVSGTLNASNVWVRLKTGLTVNTYNETITIGGGGVTGIPISVNGTVTQKPLTVTNATAADKVYDRTNAATISGTLSGIVNADVVVFNGTGTFSGVNAGNGITVTSTSTISGAQASNYTLTQPTGLTANITPKNVSISNPSVLNKVYDGNTSATISGTLTGIISPDVVSLNTSGSFATIFVGNGIAVTSTSTLAGAQAANYSLVQPVGLAANINQKPVSVTGLTISNKVYDGTTDATLNNAGTLTGVIAADAAAVMLNSTNINAAFLNALAGTNKPVNVSGLSIEGSAAFNYILNQPTGVTGNITPKQLTVSNAVASDKTYDRTTAATFTGTLNGIVNSDQVNLNGSGIFASVNAGNNISVTSGATLSGADASNYSLLQPTGLSASIFPKSIIISGAAAQNKVYNATDAAIITGTLSGIISGDLVILNGSGIFAGSSVGNSIAVTSTSTISGAQAANYTLTQPVGLTANITPAILSVTGISINNKIYDGNTDATINGSGTLSGVIGTDDVSLSSSTIVANFNNASVGNNKPVSVAGFSISGNDAANYMLPQPSGLTASITGKAITANAMVLDKVYDRTTTAIITGTLNGVEPGDVVTFSGSGNFASVNVGTGISVTSTSTLTGTNAGNYILIQPTGLTADITPKTINVTSAVASSKMYDGNTAATISGTLTGVISPDVVTFSGSGSFATPNVGTGIAVTSAGTLSGAQASNYTLTQPTGLTANITPAILSVSGISVNNKVYDGNTNATINGSGTLIGVIGTDDVSLSSSTVVASFNNASVGNNKPVSVSGFALTGNDASNYMLTQPSGLTASITGKLITVNAVASNKVYNRTTAAIITGTLNGVEPGDVVTFNGSGNFASANVGTGISVTSTSTLGGTNAGNYTLVQPTGLTADITPRSITVTSAVASAKVYDGNTTTTISGTLSGVISPDLVTFAGSGNFAAKNVGTGIAVISTSTLSGAQAANYILTQPTGLTANITRKTITVSASADDKVYDKTTAATITGTLTGVVVNDNVVFNGTGTFSSATVGINKTVTSTSTLSGTDAANYTLTQPAGLLADITTRPLTPSISANDKLYNGNTTATLSGNIILLNLIAGDNVTATASAVNFDNKNVGVNKIVTATGITLGGPAGTRANYTLVSSTATTTASITARQLIVSSTGINKIYDGNADATVTLNDNRINGDVFTLSYTSASFDDKNAGQNKNVNVSAITISGAGALNYTLGSSTSNTTADITPAELLITVAASSKEYDGNNIAQVSLSDNRINGDVFSTDFTSAEFNDKNAGINKPVTVSGITVSGADAGNYNVSDAAFTTADINTRILHYTSTAQNKIYDGSTNANVEFTDDRVSGDILNIDYNATFGDANAGIDKPVSVSQISLSGTDALNYILQNNSAVSEADILQRPIEVRADAVYKIFGTDDPALTYTITSGSVVDGDVFSGSLVRQPGESLGTYNIEQGSLSLNDNYILTYVPALFTIISRDFNVSVTAGSIPCNNGTTTLTVHVTGAGTGLQYSLNNGTSQASNIFTVPAGTYAIVVTDSDGFSGSSDTLVVSEPPVWMSEFSVLRCDNYTLPWGGVITRSGDYVHVYTTSHGCDSTVTAHVNIDTIANVITGPNNSCRYTLPGGEIATYYFGVSNADLITWTIPANAVLLSGQGTNTIQVQFNANYTGGVVSVSVKRSCGGGIVTKNITVNRLLPVAGTITGPVNACPFLENPGTATYSVPAVSSALYYNWILSPGMSFAGNDSTSNSVVVNFETGYSSYSINVQVVSGCAISDTSTLNIGLARPKSPLVILGETNACPYIDADTVIYYVTPRVISAGNYIWSVPQGITIVSHPGIEGTLNDTIIGVKFDNSFVSGTYISVQTSSRCGTSFQKNLIISRSQAPVPGIITGPTVTCAIKVGVENPSGTPATYTISKVRYATSYNWILSQGVTLISHNAGTGANDTSITVRFESSYDDGGIGVQSVSGCGVSVVRNLIIKDGNIGLPGAMSGPVNPCPLIGGPDTTQYKINRVNGATQYIWSVPSGAEIVARPGGEGTANDTVIVVRYTPAFVSGSITVLPRNNCAVSNVMRSLPIIRKLPAVPSMISGPVNPCAVSGNIVTYSIASLPLNATSVKWTAPAGATIIGADDGLSVQVSFSSNFTSGAISVAGVNSCSNGSAKNLNLVRKAASIPGLITATLLSACPERKYTYSIAAMPANAVSVNWSVPDGGTILSGQGTTSITVSYTTGIVTGTVKVAGIDGCSQEGVSRMLNVNLSACTLSPKTLFVQNERSSEVSGKADLFEINVYPNPTSSSFSLRSVSTGNESVHMSIMDITGKLYRTITFKEGETIRFGDDLKKGIYFLEIVKANEKIVRKVIKL